MKEDRSIFFFDKQNLILKLSKYINFILTVGDITVGVRI